MSVRAKREKTRLLCISAAFAAVIYIFTEGAPISMHS